MNEENLLKFADFLEQLKTHAYQWNPIEAISFLPEVFPYMVKWHHGSLAYKSASYWMKMGWNPPAQKVFNMTSNEVQAIFGYPLGAQSDYDSRKKNRIRLNLSDESHMISNEFTPKYVAGDIRQFIKLKKSNSLNG